MAMNKQTLLSRLKLAGYTHQFADTKDHAWKRCFVKNGSGATVARVSLYHDMAVNIKYYNNSVTKKLLDTLTYKELYSEYCKVQCRGFLTMAQVNELRVATMLEF